MVLLLLLLLLLLQWWFDLELLQSSQGQAGVRHQEAWLGCHMLITHWHTMSRDLSVSASQEMPSCSP